MATIPMVNLKAQYLDIKEDIDNAIQEVLNSTQFIKGSAVKEFEKELANHLGVKHVIACANGTDALQLALMGLDLNSGDEIITPAFSYIACAETIALLGLKPVLVDVNADDFNIDTSRIESRISPRTKAIMPVHLFGQSCDMDVIMSLAKKYNLYVIEDNAQSIGSYYSGHQYKSFSGTIADIGTTSFFPSKNLGCYGDGGALFTNNDTLAKRIRQLANHGQSTKYIHPIIGINSRLDTIQAAILKVKLKHLSNYIRHRQQSAEHYRNCLKDTPHLILPQVKVYTTHVFHQYTLRITNGRRDALKSYLDKQGISNSIYYPIPIHHQEAYKDLISDKNELETSTKLCSEVLSIPIDSHISRENIEFVSNHISTFMNI